MSEKPALDKEHPVAQDEPTKAIKPVQDKSLKLDQDKSMKPTEIKG